MKKFSHPRLSELPATNIAISGGTFYDIAGDAHTHYYAPPVPDDRGFQNLSQNIASEALYDSAELSFASMCHPNTRSKIQKRIMDWVRAGNPESSIFWLHARVGEGKTAIMRSVAHALSAHGLDVPTFFFGRGKGKREQSQYLFLTLAHQLTLRIRGLRECLNEIMMEKPDLVTSSMEAQVRSLFLGAFHRIGRSVAPQVLLIDGLDECNSELDQQRILGLIGEMITLHALPLRFVIASRPEPQLQDMFNRDILRNITLRATISDGLSSLKDIDMFFRQKFGEIYSRKSYLIGGTQGSNWPSDDIIEVLVHRSSGQFIYATTVIRFIEDKFCHPKDQLKIILSSQSSDKQAFTELDSLYLHILSTYPEDKIEDLKRVLGFVLALSRTSGQLLEDLLQLRSCEPELILGGLHAVLSGLDSQTISNARRRNDRLSWADYIVRMRFSNGLPSMVTEDHDPDIDITHASFVDFLLDPSRSGPYHVDLAAFDIRIVIAAFAMMSSLVCHSLERGTFRRPFSVDTLLAMETVLPPHLARLNTLPQCVLDDICSLEEIFRVSDRCRISPIPVESFVGIYLFITVATKSLDDGRPEYKAQLVDLRNRYLRLLFLWCEDNFPWKGTHLEQIRGILVIQTDLPTEVLADIFMVSSQLVEKCWKNQGLDIQSCGARSILVRCLESFSALDSDSEVNRSQLKRVEWRHLDMCRKLVSRAFSGKAVDLSDPCPDTVRYMSNHFADHLAGLRLTPSDLESASEFLKFFDEQLEKTELAKASPQTLSSIWILLKSILNWLCTMDKKGPIASCFLAKANDTLYNIHRMVLCIKSSVHGQGEITIRQPFLETERHFLKSRFLPAYRFRTSLEDALVPISGAVEAVSDGTSKPFGISSDLFLLDVGALNLGWYLTDAVRSGNLYLPIEKFYSSLFKHLQIQLTVMEEGYDIIQETKRKMLVKACVQYLQEIRYCNSIIWLGQGGSGWGERNQHDRRPCGILAWCEFILKFLRRYYFYDLEKRKVEDIVINHTHLFEEEL